MSNTNTNGGPAVEVPLVNGGVALVSPCDYERVMSYEWRRQADKGEVLPFAGGLDPAAPREELHGLFVNERIPAHAGGHVLDAIGRFSQPLGITQTAVEWNLATPPAAVAWANAQWQDDGRPVLAISPCSSHALRNWRADRYAALASMVPQLESSRRGGDINSAGAFVFDAIGATVSSPFRLASQVVNPQ